nr:hypothetical protein Q903MT_gene3380 [Picea sitchensis]
MLLFIIYVIPPPPPNVRGATDLYFGITPKKGRRLPPRSNRYGHQSNRLEAYQCSLDPTTKYLSIPSLGYSLLVSR